MEEQREKKSDVRKTLDTLGLALVKADATLRGGFQTINATFGKLTLPAFVGTSFIFGLAVGVSAYRKKKMELLRLPKNTPAAAVGKIVPGTGIATESSAAHSVAATGTFNTASSAPSNGTVTDKYKLGAANFSQQGQEDEEDEEEEENALPTNVKLAELFTPFEIFKLFFYPFVVVSVFVFSSWTVFKHVCDIKDLEHFAQTVRWLRGIGQMPEHNKLIAKKQQILGKKQQLL
eukprot:GDKI01023292.1.p1 GENE.GDKI01023292.1~~GDKI01023292.1.p1  ORF type:complete len:233 (+),score=43.90 GDKI01023292.1:39-737(+)